MGNARYRVSPRRNRSSFSRVVAPAGLGILGREGLVLLRKRRVFIRGWPSRKLSNVAASETDRMDIAFLAFPFTLFSFPTARLDLNGYYFLLP